MVHLKKKGFSQSGVGHCMNNTSIINQIGWKIHFAIISFLPIYLLQILQIPWQHLTHWGWVTLICISKLTIIGSDNGFIAWRAPSHYMNQCWNIVNWTIRNKFQWNFNQYYNLFIQENACESVCCEMVAILSQPQCVKCDPQGWRGVGCLGWKFLVHLSGPLKMWY